MTPCASCFVLVSFVEYPVVYNQLVQCCRSKVVDHTTGIQRFRQVPHDAVGAVCLRMNVRKNMPPSAVHAVPLCHRIMAEDDLLLAIFDFQIILDLIEIATRALVR